MILPLPARWFTHGAISAHRAEFHGAQVWTTTIPTITARGHVPNDQAALECAFLAVMALDPTCARRETSSRSCCGSCPPRTGTSPPPLRGGEVRHQVAHLAWTYGAVLSAIEDPEAFAGLRERFARDPDVVDRAAQQAAARPPAEILESWCRSQSRVLAALAAVPAGARIPWIDPPLGAAMMASARIMETWTHGQDVRDALGLPPSDSPRLRHIAHLAVAARHYAFGQRHLPPPAEPFRVELTSDSGDELWTWGAPDAAQRVRGTALDFAPLATRRRHRQDCDVTAAGPGADAWLDIVQAYAGPPGPGREPRSATGREADRGGSGTGRGSGGHVRGRFT